MNKRRMMLVGGSLGVFILVGIAAFVLRPSTSSVRFQDKLISHWLEALDSSDYNVRANALNAFVAMGAEAIPLVLREEEKVLSSFQKRYWDFWSKRSMFQRKFLPKPNFQINDMVVEAHGDSLDALRAIGAPGIPQLLAILQNEKEQTFKRERTARALFLIQYDGHDLSDSAPVMIKLLNAESLEIKLWSVRILGGMGKSAEPAVVILTEILVNVQNGNIQLEAPLEQAILEAIEKIQPNEGS